MPKSKTVRARLARVRDMSRELGYELSQREVRTVAKSVQGLPITDEVVQEEATKLWDLKASEARSRKTAERFNDLARGRFRIAGSMWEARVQLVIARTSIRFWIEIDEVRPADRELLKASEPAQSEMRALAQRLRSASKLVTAPIKQRCVDLDLEAMISVSDDDLVFVKAAMRQIEFRTAVPAAILATIETVHARALSKSVALGRLSANPHDISTIVGKAEPRAKRKIVALLGPTNSGKTHAGLELMSNADSGAYLGPLRLMALEQYDRMRERNINVAMCTGEEAIIPEGATHLSATIEMADTSRHFSVVVVDEAQLLDHPQRGWAWTHAIFHSRCDTLVVTGSADCLPILERIAALTGEVVEVKTFERRSPLVGMLHPIAIEQLQAGDAVIAFSRANVLAMKAEISKLINPATGNPFTIATIYGALGPEVRRSEARRFSTGEAEILVATDAIGMGLNLPIDRVIFSALNKYDGRIVRDLDESEIRQIGGRAGRLGKAGGIVGMLTGAGLSTNAIQNALSRQPKPVRDHRPYIWPTINQVLEGMDLLDIGVLSKALPAVSALLRQGPDYRCSIGPDTIDLLETLEQQDLTVEQAHDWIGCPLSLRDSENRKCIQEWACLFQKGYAIRAPYLDPSNDVDDEIDDHRLKEIERAVVQAGAYIWLSRRWPEAFHDVELATETRRVGNRMIEDALRQRQIHRNCIECSTPIGYRVRQETCRVCSYS
jgi:hypothetical protein